MKTNAAFLLCSLSVGSLGAAVSPAPIAARAAAPASQVFEVQQMVALSEVPKGTRRVRLWISIPDDDPAQRVLDFSVASAPGPWRLVREPDRGNRFLFVEVADPGVDVLMTTVNFTVRRSAVFYELNPAAAGALSEAQRHLFADELRRDAPHMAVTDEIRRIADDTCGKETNLVTQACRLLDYVAEHADHYSKDPSKPKCGIGDAADCMTNGGGCCTDIHSLFIALARARGIPARLQMGYRLQPKNAGVEADPGYRCWPEYFIPGYGWVPADIVEADAADAAGRVRWLSGLSERRVHLNEGREFDLSPRQNAARVNTMIVGYAEIDGVPVRVLPEGEKKSQLSRTVKYVERPDTLPVPLAGGVKVSWRHQP
jgi:transglutaminase-like putative cysteine protease